MTFIPEIMNFPETNWTMMAAATMNGNSQEQEALNTLCRQYWRPVASAISAKGAPSDRIDDLTQEFFLQMMKLGLFKRADRDKGRFRTYMLGSLRFFLADDVKFQKTQKRGGHLERSQLQDDSASIEVDEAQFDRAWAESLFKKVMVGVQKDMEFQRGSEVWAMLQKFLPGFGNPPSYTELAAVMGVKEAGAKSEVFRLRQKFRSELRAQVALTVSAPHEIDEELAHLRSALAGSRMIS